MAENLTLWFHSIFLNGHSVKRKAISYSTPKLSLGWYNVMLREIKGG